MDCFLQNRFFLVISYTIMCYVWMMSLLPFYGIISLLYNGEIPFLVCIFFNLLSETGNPKWVHTVDFFIVGVFRETHVFSRVASVAIFHNTIVPGLPTENRTFCLVENWKKRINKAGILFSGSIMPLTSQYVYLTNSRSIFSISRYIVPALGRKMMCNRAVHFIAKSINNHVSGKL